MKTTAPRPMRLEFAELPGAATIVVVPAARLAIAADWLTWEQALACLARMLDEHDGAWCVTAPSNILAARANGEATESLRRSL